MVTRMLQADHVAYAKEVDLRERRDRYKEKLDKYEAEAGAEPSVDEAKVHQAESRLQAQVDKVTSANRKQRNALEHSMAQLQAESGCETPEQWHRALEDAKSDMQYAIGHLEGLGEKVHSSEEL